MKLYADMLTGFHYVTECEPGVCVGSELARPFEDKRMAVHLNGSSSHSHVMKRQEFLDAEQMAANMHRHVVAGVGNHNKIRKVKGYWVEISPSTPLEFIE